MLVQSSTDWLLPAIRKTHEEIRHAITTACESAAGRCFPQLWKTGIAIRTKEILSQLVLCVERQ